MKGSVFMTLNLYSTSSDPRTVDKQLSLIASELNIKPLQTFNILTPVITLNYATSYLNANYAYIPELGRYYFINSTDLEIGKRIVFSCVVDVLMSYKTEIRNCPATVIRSEMFPPNQVVDDKLPVDPNGKELRVIEFSPESEYPFSTDALLPVDPDINYLLGVM